MAELSKQQIEQAIVAFENTEGHQKTGELLSMKERMLRAAPYLQLPWDEPTYQPVDPRREKIIDAIHRYGYFGNKEALADNIIAALSEVK
jgi:hypothetical protein